jgi:hypothetical protein
LTIFQFTLIVYDFQKLIWGKRPQKFLYHQGTKNTEKFDLGVRIPGDKMKNRQYFSANPVESKTNSREISKEKAFKVLEALTNPNSHYWGKVEFHFENSEVKRVQANVGMVKGEEVEDFVQFLNHEKNL